MVDYLVVAADLVKHSVTMITDYLAVVDHRAKCQRECAVCSREGAPSHHPHR